MSKLLMLTSLTLDVDECVSTAWKVHFRMNAELRCCEGGLSHYSQYREEITFDWNLLVLVVK